MAIAIIGLPPVPGSTFYWDGLNGFGVAGLAMLLLCCWIGPAARAGYSVHALRLHIGASLVMLTGVTAHALGMLLSNDVMLEYLKWRAPLYMHAGNIGFVLMFAVSILSVRRVRRRLHANFNSFRTLHRGLSAGIILLTGWHVIGSGYLAGAAQGAATAWAEHWHFPGIEYWRGWMLAAALFLTTALWWRTPDRIRHPAATARNDVHRITLWLLLITLAVTGLYLIALNLAAVDSSQALAVSILSAGTA